MFSLFKKACLLYKTSKIIFHHLLSRSMKWEDRGLKGVLGVRRGYKELQGVKRGNKKLQGVTRGDKEWQGVTKDYKNFFLTRTFPDTFSWSILHKNSKLKKSQIFDQNHGPFGNPLEKFEFSVFHKHVLFIVFKGFFFI